MYLTFQDKRIRKICEIERVGRESLGDELFAILAARLADLLAAEGLGDLPIALRPRGVDSGEQLLELRNPWYLVVEENRDVVVQGKKSRVSTSPSLKILRIERRHD